MIRVDKFLCDTGAGSRSQVRAILKSGRVQVDGVPCGDPNRKVDPELQQITLDGQILTAKKRRVLMLHKPAGYVTATEDAKEKTVMELLPPQFQKLKPVGRLDKETEGLLLFTDDGDLLHHLISPKKQVRKVYYAKHEGCAQEEDIRAFEEGLTLRDGTRCLPAVLTPLGPGESKITVYEGKYHQVRRMMASRQMTVTYLRREQEGSLSLGNLPKAQVRELNEEEIGILTGETVNLMERNHRLENDPLSNLE